MDPKELEAIVETLEQESSIKEKLRDASSDFERQLRTMMATLAGIHYTPALKRSSLLDTVRTLQQACQDPVVAIAETVPENQYWRWKDFYGRHIQNFVFVLALTEYLTSRKLVSIQDVSVALGMKEEWHDRVHVQVEDYLHGVISVINELSRLSVNSVTMGDFGEPFKIHKFANDVFAGYSMLNLKNDVLRKRFDGLKYDLKKIEEVVYDLSVRGLAPAEATASSS